MHNTCEVSVVSCIEEECYGFGKSLSPSPQYLLYQRPVRGCLDIPSSSRQPPPHTVRARFTTHTLNISTIWLQQTARLVPLETNISAGTVTAFTGQTRINVDFVLQLQFKGPLEKWHILE